jgi:type II secretory ATPase GspE/PulE/Tfp pilus assembly ATPase PilB-like protein
VDEPIRALITRRASASELKRAAATRSLRDDGIAKILAGVTTIPEVERVVSEA